MTNMKIPFHIFMMQHIPLQHKSMKMQTKHLPNLMKQGKEKTFYSKSDSVLITSIWRLHRTPAVNTFL
jgi:hypothetical protein